MAIYKCFYFKHGCDRNGKQIVDGAVKIFLRKPFSQTALASTRDVNTANGSRTVTNVEGSVKLDDFMVKQIKYFFNIDLGVNSYLNVRVGVWGSMGKALAKFNLNEGDLYMFMASRVELQNFTKKDGSTGYQLNVNAFDFEPIRTAGRNNQNGSASQNTDAAPQAAQPSYNAGPGADDFAAIDDSGDLPF